MSYFGADNIIILICALCCAPLTTATNSRINSADDLPAVQSLVDGLIVDYFNTEKLLWQRIGNRADNILLQVFKSHERFFDQAVYHSGSGVLARHLIPNIDALVNIGLNVNNTAELGQTHLKEQTLDRQSITEYSNFALKILKDASNLFEYATNDTLWEHVITVSVHLCSESHSYVIQMSLNG